MTDLLSGLNPQQREAVRHTEGPLLILAGAGSGKTRVITHRIAYLVEQCGVSPAAILGVTFTNKASEEMRERIAKLVSPEKCRRLTISTFHAACLKFLRRHIHLLGYKNDFLIYDAGDQLALVKGCTEALSVNEDLYPPRTFLTRISQLKHQLMSPAEFAEKGADYGLDDKLKKVYALYQERLLAAQGLDFDDLLGLTIRLFESVPEVCRRYREQYEYILVDEYQDTNPAQYRLIRLLTSERRNLCVVGDDDQSIYAFRGADVGNILSFERDFPDTKVVILNQNYRSTRTILAAASAVIENNTKRKSKQLFTENPTGEPILWSQVESEEEEAGFVRDTIRGLVDREGRTLSDFCILYRTNAQSRVMEEALRNAGIPYFIFGGLRFYERKEIKDLIAYLRLTVYPEDALSLRRVINLPQRGVGTTSLDRLATYAETHALSLYDAIGRIVSGSDAMLPDQIELTGGARRGLSAFYQFIEAIRIVSESQPLSQVVRYLIEELHYLDYLKKEFTTEAEGRIENVMEFIDAADQFHPIVDEEELSGVAETERPTDLKAFLDQIALVSNGDERDASGGGVTLMTLHSAKGLEFPVVFLIGMEEGLFPHSRSLTDLREMEEERRLCYVGMTRAMERLYLVSAAHRRLYGSSQWNAPSRFIQELPKEGITIVSRRPAFRPEADGRRAQSWRVKKESDDPVYNDIQESEAGLFPVGAMVRHPLFGIGRVQRCEGEGEGAKVTVAFSSAGTKKLALKYARLEKCS
ncbi:MAG: UvrD-helicase domain-containing protein [Candidatus Manganitrophus sp. SB1]|nr:UvrD-helicase domain-containing protein [Candidatus Manganitrophus morganii]